MTTLKSSFFMYLETSSLLFVLTCGATSVTPTPQNSVLNQRIPGEPIGLTDQLANLFWFAQITDLHLYNANLFRSFEVFCSQTVPIIRPELLVISGDLVDASPIYFISRQNVSEWQTYHRILHESGVLNITKVFDLRGNHDMMDVLAANHSSDYFSQFGIQGRIHPRSYRFNLTKPFGRYSFIFLDASPPVGVKIPLNYFGQLTRAEEERLMQYASESDGSNHTFVFGHYTTSTIGPGTIDLRGLLGTYCFAYFCGHMHTADGLIPEMHVLQPEGYLELELGDWKYERYYRVIAVDDDMVSFVNVKASTWPVLLVTNPKNSNFLLPNKEPARRILTSTHIRILAWSIQPILNISVTIDGKYQGKATQTSAGTNLSSPLYTLPWNASHWADHLVHTIRVLALDTAGNQHAYEHVFVVDRAPTWEFAFMARMALQTNLSLFVSSFRSRRKYQFYQGLYRIVHSNCSFLSILGLCFYQCLGPSYIGFILSQQFGAVFSFGIFVFHQFVVDAVTYSLELIQLYMFLLIYLPYVIWYFGYDPSSKPAPEETGETELSDMSTQKQAANIEKVTPELTTHDPVVPSIRWIGLIPLPLFIHAIIFTTFQFVFILLTVAIPYGPSAAFLCPGRLLPIAVCWFIACKSRSIMYLP
ncbi:hypothetical protein CRM22_003748 [Opisthorchis felineus]|uniref:Uncharacterized protein n=1 Tax=Opisthorchis felineus TaxID=147828 RepID=A0A4S2LZS0_OPIFE|nr:hypothetical protein CRM22_003748 [Opisthorchis felineus]TGZ69435.1 hypothetical protein CRM22_003748 [Opisthorchis felineus]TGZ69436.1 hypothetical protein CRM22_003748 [Opisthorchis felineus]TGZ69437.1 hypothetical protein CRM22_003748 [Opisthorchis felineus]TGZ69438.1 hypothetical protein CRM22_003748 [Opisthorchis felineus]